LNGKYRPKRWSFQRGKQKIKNGLERMKRTLDHEINRLTALQKKNKDIRPDEIQAAVEERNALSALIKKARARLDAVQLIRKELGRNALMVGG